MQLNAKGRRILSLTLATWGFIFIVTGLVLNAQDRTVVKKVYAVNVNSKKVAQLNANRIELKDMELEINNPLSVDVKDYLQDPNSLEKSVINALKLDTSMVNINEAGIYSYTVTFKKNKYSAKFTIKAKEVPNFTLTLKELNLQVGDAISTNVSSYIKENLPIEVLNNITLDLSEVTTAKPDTYQYKITYNGKIYTGKIIVTEKPSGPTIIKPSSSDTNSSTNTNTNQNTNKKDTN